MTHTGFMRRLALCMMAVLLTTALADAADSISTIKKRLTERHQQIVSLKSQGKIGETYQGNIEAIKSVDATTAAVIKAENKDRKELYELLAKEQNTTVEAVRKQSAIFKFKRAALTELFKGRDGVWRTKQQMLKAIKNK